MELNQIKYFLNLAETLNFTSAARQSGISQPSLTKSIQRLEDELGAPLIYRDGKDSRLTALGRDLQAVFMRIDAQVSDAYELADLSIAGKIRTLQVGVAQTISPSTLTSFIAVVLDQLPSVELEVRQMLRGESEAEVLSGKYDLCFLTGPPQENFKIISLPLFTENLQIGLSQNHHLAKQEIIDPEDIMDQVYVDRLNCEFHTQLVQHFMDRNIVMRPRLQSEREDWVQHMTAAGIGICVLPERSGIAAGLEMRPLKGLSLSREITMVAVSGSGNPHEVRKIIDIAKTFDW
jgi:DNA-binding transcriptional LysR family regulator